MNGSEVESEPKVFIFEILNICQPKVTHKMKDHCLVWFLEQV